MKKPLRGRPLLVGTVVLAVFAVACGGGGTTAQGSSPTTPPSSPAGSPSVAGTVALNVVAQKISFDRTQLEVPANTPFKVVFDNRDSVVPHDFAIYRSGPPAADLVAKTDITQGPVVQELSVDGLPAGTYYYQCDVHPTQMTGTLTAT